MTYLTRRYSGIFYVRFRVTLFSKRRRLLRFSLETRDKIEARRTLLTYLSWLIPMQTAAVPGDLFDTILEHGRAIVLAGPAKTRTEVNRRERFVQTAWAHRLDWLACSSCPVRDHRAHACEDEVRTTLLLIGGMISQDADRLEMDQPDHASLNRGHDGLSSLCFDEITGRVRAYLPEDLAPIFDEGQDVMLGLAPGEKSFYQVYLHNDGTRRRIQSVHSVAASVPLAGRKPATATAEIPTRLSAPYFAASNDAGRTLSQAKEEYLAGRAAIKGDRRADEDAGLVMQFMIDFLGDKVVADVTRDDLHAFEMAMAQTPDRTGLPREAASSPLNRWKYGQAHGLAGLKMLSEMRVRNIWHRSLHMWFDWMASKGYEIAKYRFDVVPESPADPISRDSWTDEEMLKLFSLPLFTGCHSATRFWTVGNCFVQNELYWAYLIIFFCGLRNSEIGRLAVRNVVLDEGVWFFDLGTKPRRTIRKTGENRARTGKSKAAVRRVPISPLLIDLGLLDRVEDLKRASVTTLFPEWKNFVAKQSGRNMPGHHLSKSWQYVKKAFDFVGDELTIYGGRHTRAQWYKEIDLAEVIKRKILGHAQIDVHAVYGANVLTAAEAKLALKELPIEQQIAGILIHAKLRAEYGELQVVQTWTAAKQTADALLS